MCGQGTQRGVGIGLGGNFLSTEGAACESWGPGAQAGRYPPGSPVLSTAWSTERPVVRERQVTNPTGPHASCKRCCLGSLMG